MDSPEHDFEEGLGSAERDGDRAKITVDKDETLAQRIAELRELRELRELELSFVAPEHLSDLSQLTGLTKLSIICLDDGGTLPDISPISNLTGLKDLTVEYDGRQEEDWSGSLWHPTESPLRHLTGLTRLATLQFSTRDVNFVGQLADLKHLELTEANALLDISGLSTLQGLTHLSLNFYDYDIYSWPRLPALESLNLYGNEEMSSEQIRTLARMYPGLKFLDISSAGFAPLPDLRPLLRCPRLEVLVLGKKWMEELESTVGSTASTSALYPLLQVAVAEVKRR